MNLFVVALCPESLVECYVFIPLYSVGQLSNGRVLLEGMAGTKNRLGDLTTFGHLCRFLGDRANIRRLRIPAGPQEA
ncbi:hypothetical protein KAR10_01300 [bacterium]|nr:hypothetical protein [bacterium]